MKLKFHYRSRRFTPKLRVALAEPRDARLQTLREGVEADFAELREARGHLLKLTLNEAEALALQTPVPHLVFPLLAQEKVSALAAWHERQNALWPGEQPLAFAE
jgi:hypothetical protein